MSMTSTSDSWPITTCRSLAAFASLWVLVLATGCAAAPQAKGPYQASLFADGFTQPLFLTAAPGDPSRLFVLEQVKARIRVIKDGEVQEEPFLDLGEIVTDRGGEMGLLGLAFHPKYEENGFFYVNYTPTYSRGEKPGTIIARYSVKKGNPDQADPDSKLIILGFSQPYPNHNGGMITFGPDGYLYIGTGDGGSGGDPLNAGQDKKSILGKILRIDVDAKKPYGIPPDNPFVKGGDGLPEIYASGLRNPWRFSWDAGNNAWFIGDVGQNAWEEISVMPGDQPGLNFGWRIMEGSHCFNPRNDCDPSGLTMPIHEYSHKKVRNASITGGYVYRGKAIPELQGKYLFGDFTNGHIWTLDYKDGKASNLTEITDAIQSDKGNRVENLSSFGRDLDGEIYLVDYRDGEIYKLTPTGK